MVVSLNYPKAPQSPFPEGAKFLESLIHVVLDDPTITPHVDKSDITLLGWSAGGNFSLVLSAQPSIRPLIKAVVPMYPVVDITVPREVKAATRRWKPSLGGFRANVKDYLYDGAHMFDWAYVPIGHSYSDPMLSPYFYDRKDYPNRVFVVACEMDMLAQEAWRMACKLAGREIPDVREIVGQQKPVGEGELKLDDEKFYFEEDGTGGSYRWLLVPDTIHGFDQKIEPLVRDDVTVKDARIKTEKVVKMIGEWLYGSSRSSS